MSTCLDLGSLFCTQHSHPVVCVCTSALSCCHQCVKLLFPKHGYFQAAKCHSYTRTMCQQHKSWMCISFTLAMDSREWRRQAVPGRLPRDVPRDGLGTRGCNGTMVQGEQQSTWLLHEDLACPVLAGEGGHISSLWYSSLLPWRM